MNYRLFATFLLATLVILSCDNQQQDHSTEDKIPVMEDDRVVLTKAQFEKSGYELGQMEKRLFKKSIQVSGHVELPQNRKASISSLMPGTVGSFDKFEGQWVRKGSVLFTLTNPELIKMQQRYFDLKAHLNHAQERINRVKEIASENLIKAADFAEMEHDLETTKIALKALRQELELYGIEASELNINSLQSSIVIKAPIAGYIISINVTPGSYLTSDQTAMVINSSANEYLELGVLERDLHLIDLGQEVYISLPSNEKITASVIRIDQNVSEDRLVQVTCRVNKLHQKLLKTGMSVTADIVTDNYETKSLPQEAMVKLGQETVVLALVEEVNDKMIFEKIVVETGERSGEFVAVQNAESLVNRTFLTKGAYYNVH